MKNLFRFFFITLFGIFSSVQLYAQAVDMVIDEATMTPAQPVYPGQVSFSFQFYAELGTHEMGSDDLGGNYATITVTLSKLNGIGIMPTGAGADLFTWTYNPVTKVYSGKSKDVFVQEDVFYPIVFTNLATTEVSTVNDVGFIANLTPPGDLLGSDPADDKVSVYASSPLPVTLVSFTAQKEGQTALLKWATTEETNSDYFEVQHSMNGKEWAKLDRVASNGESTSLKNYTFTHATPVNGENLYRLKMVDKDLTFAYSRIQSVQFEGLSENDLSVYPNPTVDVFKIREFSQVTKVSINDMNGRTVLETGKSTTGEISVRNLPSGIYLVRVSRSTGITSTQKIVVGK